MKKGLILKTSSLVNIAVFCFLAGILAGTLFFCFFSGEGWEVKREFFRGFVGTRTDVITECLKTRIIFTVGLWILGISLLSFPGTMLTIFWLGCSFAISIASCTASFGGRGLVFFLVLGFPHMLCYIPVWLILFYWGLQGNMKFHLLGFSFLLLITCVGAAAETYFQPLVLSFLRETIF